MPARSSGGITAGDVRGALDAVGCYHVQEPIAFEEYVRLATELGDIIGEEIIALRPNAHAYVAKPGPVPLHTDHPDAAIVAWWCAAPDAVDGASHLLDSRPVVDALPAVTRDLLQRALLWCPELGGGPPNLMRAVLWDEGDGRGTKLFCSPWLRCAVAGSEFQTALDDLRARLSEHAERALVRVRLDAGQALFVDNRRVLHGRGAIEPTSRRSLLRLWLSNRPARARQAAST
jgi:hypothetical protein